MTKLALSGVVLAVLGSAAPLFASAQTVARPSAAAGDRFTDATVAGLVAQARVREWSLASNSSNADEIYVELLKAGGKPACQERRITVNSEDQTVQDCQVAARVTPLTIVTNPVVVAPSTVVVDVQGDVACQQTWYVVPLGRRQKAERWVFCQIKGVARAR
jgi:hypothetical protein